MYICQHMRTCMCRYINDRHTVLIPLSSIIRVFGEMGMVVLRVSPVNW